MLIVLNELKNNREDHMVNFNPLKSVITDDTIRINENNQPGRITEFYDNIQNFFIKYDLLTFNIRDIPMTEAKMDLIQESRSLVDRFICDNYDSLVKGMKFSIALGKRPKEITQRGFELQIKQICEHKSYNEWHEIMVLCIEK